jgi:hypothetical protein
MYRLIVFVAHLFALHVNSCSDPISAIHQEILDAYMSHGRETVRSSIPNIVLSHVRAMLLNVLPIAPSTNTLQLSGATRFYFVLHRQGFIVPIRGHMASSGDSQVMIAEELQTNMSFLWFQGEETGWRITTVCHNSQQLLGIDLAAMRAGAVTLTHYLSDVVNVLDAVREASAGDGCVVNLRNVVVGEGERGFSATASIVAKLQVNIC